jgi:hypothetical protein
VYATFVNWASYCGLFTFDERSRQFSTGH